MEAIKKLTPKDIVGNYKIPIYQRLFEWDTENINTLLSDLWHSFKVSEGKDDYYIGMLTSTKGNELVDGQQRFVVMMLMGCVLKEYDGRWESFIGSAEQPRLYFLSRPKDNKYLKALIKGERDIYKECINVKMKNGKEQISTFLQFESKEERKEEREGFAKYIYEHLSFFITELPDYSPTDLNLYFERMNTTGRNLEQHEILKVKLLRHLDDSSTYMQLWNKLADVDTLLTTPPRENEKEEASNSLSIEKILPSNERPSADRHKIHDSRCPLTFPELLLQTLYLLKSVKEEDVPKDKDTFFNTGNLLDTFSNYLPYEGQNVKKEDIKSFMTELQRCRQILDVCFIRRTEDGYSLDMKMKLSDEDESNESKKKLMMYESMLYVSSSSTTYYKWFGWLMSCVESPDRIPSADELCKKLKRKDNEEQRKTLFLNNKTSLNEDDLSYPNINRYWFWRLDYYLWETRDDWCKCKDGQAKDREEYEKYKAAVSGYVFRENRSIEHFHPQNQSHQLKEWNEKDKHSLHSFGNLAMISKSFNSQQGNDYLQIKFDRIQEQINKNSLQSIKLLRMCIDADFEAEKWNLDAVTKHGEEMMKILNESLSNAGTE